MSLPPFEKVALIGIGLIGSSLARALRRQELAETITACARSEASRQRALELGIADQAVADPAVAVKGADLVVLGVPLGAMESVAAAMAPGLAKGAIVTDVGSAKRCVIDDVLPLLPNYVHFVPGHPIAGTEHSGPDAGFAELFENRWCILIEIPGQDKTALRRMIGLWRAVGSMVMVMDAQHHDAVLALTSHLPHLIAYTIVGTACNLEESSRSEVIKFSASGFRDFTRIAASDPVMWRDVFLKNKDAVLDMLQRFNEDLTALQRAIRYEEGDRLVEWFTRTREIRRSILEAKQA